MDNRTKNKLLSHPSEIGKVLKIVNALNPKNRDKGTKNNTIKLGAVFRNNSCFKIEGTGNTIIVEDFSRLIDTNIYIHGNNNRIHIGKRCYLKEAEFYIENAGNEIVIGDHTSVNGKTQFATIEGTRIMVGEDCMFSQDINVRTGDAHSIVDSKNKRLNYSKDITIGNHCWIGMRSIIMKGAVIKENSVIGAGAIVTKAFEKGNCVITGTPGKIIQDNIDWLRERV